MTSSNNAIASSIRWQHVPSQVPPKPWHQQHECAVDWPCPHPSTRRHHMFVHPSRSRPPSPRHDGAVFPTRKPVGSDLQTARAIPRCTNQLVMDPPFTKRKRRHHNSSTVKEGLGKTWRVGCHKTHTQQHERLQQDTGGGACDR